MGNMCPCLKGNTDDIELSTPDKTISSDPIKDIGEKKKTSTTPANTYVPDVTTKHEGKNTKAELPPLPTSPAPTPQFKVIVALYTYQARTDDELSFEEGDRMYILDDTEQNWWLACHVSDQKVQGYVPNNYVAEADTLDSQEWYHGAVSRKEAERTLKRDGLAKGTFLVRASETALAGHTHTISVRDFDSQQNNFIVRHYKVRTNDSGMYYVSNKRTFNDLPELVQYFKDTDDGLMLISACPKNLPDSCPGGDLSPETRDKWEIDRSTLTFGKVLGTGNFGEVYQGKWKNSVDVAIKTLKQGTMKPAKFLEEAKLMKKLIHGNLVSLLAVCTKDDGPIYIVTELMKKGSLLSYLRGSEGKKLKLIEMIDIITQVACGMDYIEQHKYIHRDLAARNILVGDYDKVKIADFGLARQIEDDEYNPQAGAKFPIKWTAPEAINFGSFTIKSDVWAFGIVIYEIVTYGTIPYPGMNNKEVIDMVATGYRQPKPTYCPQSMYEKMLECWHAEKENRPTFEHLYNFFDSYFTSVEPGYTEQT